MDVAKRVSAPGLGLTSATLTPAGRQLLALLLLGLVLIGSGIGLRDPWPSDEPRFALIAKDMVESGEWFFPRRGGELYPDKPPLFMWAQAAVYAVTGSLRLAFLLPSLLSALIIVVLVYDAGRRLWRPKVGWYAGLLLLVCPQFVLEARAGQIDTMVAMWVAVALYSFLRHLLQGPQWGWYYVGFVACGLGIITKGVGFLPLLVFIPWLFLSSFRRHHGRLSTPWRHRLGGPITMLATISLWLLPMLWWVAQADDPAFAAYRDNILFQQTGQRYVAPSGHFKPWWYFLGPSGMLSLWLPWILLLPWSLPAWWRRLRRREPRYCLLLGWSMLVLLFFSLSPAKRAVYILPALPWACLAVAPILLHVAQRSGLRRLALTAAGMFAAVLLALAAYLSFFRPQRAAELIERYDFDPTLSVWITGLGLGALVLLLRQRPLLAYSSSMVVLWLTVSFGVYPALDEAKSGRGLMLAVERMLPAQAPLALVDWKEQTLLQARRPVTNFGFLVAPEQQLQGAMAWAKAHPQGYVLTQQRTIPACLPNQDVRFVASAHRRRWYLLSAHALSQHCRG